jgi:hypothetical protein
MALTHEVEGEEDNLEDWLARYKRGKDNISLIGFVALMYRIYGHVCNFI